MNRNGWSAFETSRATLLECLSKAFRSRSLVERIWLSFLWRYLAWSTIAGLWIWFVVVVTASVGFSDSVIHWTIRASLVLSELFVTYLAIKYALGANGIPND